MLVCAPIANWLSGCVAKMRKRNRGRSRPVETPDLTDMCGPTSPALLLATSPQIEDDTKYPNWPPLNPRMILASREFYYTRFATRKYRSPCTSTVDNPVYSLYRLYEWIMSGHIHHLRREMEVIWWARWPIASIPDPGENGDPERYAVLACIPGLLVQSFNDRNRLGMRRAEPHGNMSIEEQLRWAATPPVFEEVPFWTENVPPLEMTLHIPLGPTSHVDILSMDDPNASEVFKERNILIRHPQLTFLSQN